ncbi:hypothetical protein BK138_34410 [Paenibacillus rhizosphaerae]|uniref:Uncharacterized protein n=1 Tax=Paenibacillus rhizosphaerae TaxID=297318 RepID=A0A1R1DYX7_9BACL|nr:hypothetical protein [Paenibacillus rhizosphaerae]OMF44738.1 hypothetical protein BK138_34410 [Paenibacillus rhizosphaerae]
MGDRKRIEVTFDTEKHADILAEMEKFGNSAGFLKFAAAHYINMIRSNKSSGISNVRDLYKKQDNEESESKGRRRLPPGVGGQGKFSRLSED